MKNIEKFAVDAVIAKFNEENELNLESLEAARKALEDAKKNYLQCVSPLNASAKKLIEEYREELSTEALSYYETSIATTIKSQFKLS